MAGAVRSHLIWVLIGIPGAFALGLIAIDRGEHVTALWIVVATVAVDLIASGHCGVPRPRPQQDRAGVAHARGPAVHPRDRLSSSPGMRPGNLS